MLQVPAELLYLAECGGGTRRGAAAVSLPNPALRRDCPPRAGSRDGCPASFAAVAAPTGVARKASRWRCSSAALACSAAAASARACSASRSWRCGFPLLGVLEHADPRSTSARQTHRGRPDRPQYLESSTRRPSDRTGADEEAAMNDAGVTVWLSTSTSTTSLSHATSRSTAGASSSGTRCAGSTAPTNHPIPRSRRRSGGHRRRRRDHDFASRSAPWCSPALCGLVGSDERRLPRAAGQPRGGPGAALPPRLTPNGADIRLAVDAVEDMSACPT